MEPDLLYQSGQLLLEDISGNEFVSVDNGGSVLVKTTTAAIAMLALSNPAAFLAAMTLAVQLCPTTLPATSGVLWLNGGVLQLS